MNIDRMNKYILSQIFKYNILILFIFLSIAWLLQITRLFTISNFLYIEIYDVLLLSFFLIPNIITVIAPFILIFGLLLCFVKLNKDNELIAIISLGLGLKPLINALFIFSFVIVGFFGLLNFYFAPKIYEIYKIKEFELRNTINFNKMAFSNFLNLDSDTVLDFNKKDNEYNDIFISFNDEKDNIVYAKKGNISKKNNQFNFSLSNGFKISIDKNKQIEKLEFLNYILKIDNNKINNAKIIDKNTFTIFDDYNNKNYINISFKLTDIILILYIIFFFYYNNLKIVNFKTINNIYFSSSCICILIINQIIKNSEITILNYTSVVIFIILLSIAITNIKNRYEEN